MKNTFVCIGLSAFLFNLALPVGAANIVIVNDDGSGEGLNDPTAVAPVTGNPGTTLGAQRLNALRHAAGIWGRTLASAVDIQVNATFDPFPCGVPGGALASALSPEAFVNFSENAFPDTAYPVALANAIAGRDLNGERPEIALRFNTNVDGGCLGAGTRWWYGLAPTSDPWTNIQLLPIALHELGHGLGFDPLMSGDASGFPRGIPSIFAWHVRNIGDVSRARMALAEMTPTEIQVAIRDDPNMVWQGRYAYGITAHFLDLPSQISVRGPASIAGVYPAGRATFGPALAASGLVGDIIASEDAMDASGPSAYDACSPLTNAARVAGRIALIDRGGCRFTVKVANAQRAGAIAAIIANDRPGSINADGGNELSGIDPMIGIPSLGVDQATGNSFRSFLSSSPGTTLPIAMEYGNEAFGTNAGYLRFHAPATHMRGSSIGHWTPQARPDLLMEPDNSLNFDQLDITPFFLNDLGWELIDWNLPPVRLR